MKFDSNAFFFDAIAEQFDLRRVGFSVKKTTPDFLTLKQYKIKTKKIRVFLLIH